MRAQCYRDCRASCRFRPLGHLSPVQPSLLRLPLLFRPSLFPLAANEELAAATASPKVSPNYFDNSQLPSGQQISGSSAVDDTPRGSGADTPRSFDSRQNLLPQGAQLPSDEPAHHE